MGSEGIARQKDQKMGVLIVGVAFAAGLSISWWARTKSSPAGVAERSPPVTEGIAGFPKKTDPVAALEKARTVSRRNQLRGIALWGVASDGTVDVGEAGHRVRYVFGSARGEGPQPPRPPGTLPRRDFCGKQNVHITADGMSADPDQPSYPCASQRAEPLPDPRCSTKDLWQQAIKRGAPADRRASIEYYRAAAGPAWRFDIPGSWHPLVLYGDCERELTGADTFGSVP
jgi:hypothetical protein